MQFNRFHFLVIFMVQMNNARPMFPNWGKVLARSLEEATPALELNSIKAVGHTASPFTFQTKGAITGMKRPAEDLFSTASSAAKKGKENTFNPFKRLDD